MPDQLSRTLEELGRMAAEVADGTHGLSRMSRVQ